MRASFLVLVVAGVAVGCRSRTLDPNNPIVTSRPDAGPSRGDSGVFDVAPTDERLVEIPIIDAPVDLVPDVPVGDVVPDASRDTLPDGAGADRPPVPDPWIYVTTANGVARAPAAGGGFTSIGLFPVATRSAFPSPDGQQIAHELTNGRVVVYTIDGSTRLTLDVRPGLLGWSDNTTLLFLDPQTKYLQQINTTSSLRQYLPMPNDLVSYGYASASLSPDRSLILVFAEPLANSGVTGYYLRVLSAADGTQVLDLGNLTAGAVAWTGDNRIFIRAGASGPGYSVIDPRTRARTPGSADAVNIACGFGSWYETGKILLGRTIQSGTDVPQCIPAAVFNVDSGQNSSPGNVAYGPSFVSPPFAQSADGTTAAVGYNGALELGPVAGGTRLTVGTTNTITGVAWAHPTGGTAKWLNPTSPPSRVVGAPGAPETARRSGSADCLDGRWVNRTPNPQPAGWPAPRAGFSFAFDPVRELLLIEGGLAGNLGTLPNLDFETMVWSSGPGVWSNLSRPDGFGPVVDRPMVFDANRSLFIALGASLPSDGPWTWQPALGWANLRASALVSDGPSRTNNAASVFDSVRDRWIVSGGYTSTDTWEWNSALATWTKSMAAPPGGTTQLAGARLVYDSSRANVYLLGNRDRGTTPWLYEPGNSRWTAQPSTGRSPLPREWAGVAYDSRRDRVVVFGGFAVNTAGGGVTGVVTNTLDEWDPATGAWQACPAADDSPLPRQNAAFVYDALRDVLVLYGGETADGTPMTDLWEWYIP